MIYGFYSISLPNQTSWFTFISCQVFQSFFIDILEMSFSFFLSKLVISIDAGFENTPVAYSGGVQVFVRGNILPDVWSHGNA